MHLFHWLGFHLRSDWIREHDTLRLRFRLKNLPKPGWYMLTVLYRGESIRCYGLLRGAQGRMLLRDRLRRRLVRIPAGAHELPFELHGLNGEAQLPVLRLVRQPPWRVRRLLQRKLLRLHPGYDAASLQRPLPKLWRDYNRLLANSNWPLVGYDEWIERQERPALLRERLIAESEQGTLDAQASSAGHQTFAVRFVPGLWGESTCPDDLRRTRTSLASQLSGAYEILDPDQAADVGESDAWLVLIQSGDQLAPQALRRFAEAVARYPNAQVLYADEDRISPTGRRHSPQFKPAWNQDLLYSDPHYSHCWLIRSDLLQRAARDLEAAGEELSLYGLVLEATAAIQPDQIVHVPDILYHRVERVGECRGDASTAATLQSFLSRHGHEVSVTPRPGGGHCLQWSLPDPPPLVTVIIPTRDQVGLLRCCLDSLVNTASGNPPIELLVIDNGSTDPASLVYLDELQNRPDVTLLRRPGPFNFSAFNNEAAALARGDLLAFINNDIEALQPGWLRLMAAEALRPEVGAVGARLLFEDGSVQHAGVLLGIGGIAGHAHKYLDGESEGYQLRLRLTHQVSAVTAAALVVRRELFLEIGGFDAENFAVSYNDVDLCLRLMARGYRNIYCPDAVLVHHESRSRGSLSTPAASAQWHQERQAMIDLWGDLLVSDPHYSPHLSLVEENFALAMRSHSSPPRLSRVGPVTLASP